MEKFYYVVYRTGGFQNATWHRTLAMSKDRAIQVCEEVKRAGRKAFIVEQDLSDAIGLPTGYDYKGES